MSSGDGMFLMEKRRPLTGWKGLRKGRAGLSAGIGNLQPTEHETHQLIPALETPVPSERPYVTEKCLPPSYRFSQDRVSLVKELKDGMEEKSE